MDNEGKITAEVAKVKVDEIVSFINDPEISHSLADDLYHGFICCVAENEYDIEEAINVARTILTLNNHNLVGWYA